MAEKALFIFDIENIKGHYSRCLELIMSLEQNELQRVKNALDRFNEITTNTVRFFSSPDNIPPPRVIENETQAKSYIFSFSSNFRNNPQNTKYHIRINIKNNLDYSNLQYLALLLKRFEYMIEANPASKEHRLTVFFDGSSNFYDGGSDLYYGLSLYLRLLAKEAVGTIFAENNSRVISAIDFREYAGKSDFIPLIPIDVDSYNKLTMPIISDTFDNLFNIKGGGRFGDSHNENPKVALPDFLIESSYYILKEVYKSEKEIMEKIKTRLRKSAITLIHFVIFALLNKRYSSKIVNNKEIDDIYFDMVITLAEDIYIGIRQIIENVIQHSETKSGFFQLLLNNEDTDQILNIRVSDLNEKETLVENFKRKLEHEKETESQLSTVCETLLRVGEEINISDFFIDSKVPELKKAWDEYRKKIGMRHFGLRIFNDTLLSCKSYFQIVSNKNYKLDKRELFCNDKNQQYDNDVIPGTEVFASISLSEDSAKKELSGSTQLNYFDETYECYADFLYYQAEDKTNDIFKIFSQNRISRENNSDFNIDNPASKEEFTAMWADSFYQLKKQTKESRLFYINLDEYFNNLQDIKKYGNSEVFSRGIFRGLLLRGSNEKSFIAIINISNDVKNGAISQIKVRGGFRDTPIDTSIQLFFHVKNTEESFTLFGNTVQKAIQNTYMLSIEHGLGLFKYNDLHSVVSAEDYKIELPTTEKIKVMPFDVLITITENNIETMSLFDKKIKVIANKKIDGDEDADAGYLIKNSHTRLGSKIHIDGFYEMSFLFYRTSIANRIAFEIIQNIKNNGINIDVDEMLFYGYASYSKAIITSLVEIVNAYRKNNAKKIKFVVYQHNLQTETSKDEIQLFDGHEDDPYIIPVGTNIIQIVPISSTFTTFSKMWDKFIENYSKAGNNEWLKKYAPILNYTVFWVYDQSCPEFSRYVENTNFLFRKIKTVESLTKNEIQFLISSRLEWHSPLGCIRCFPKELINENILVETDKTSTVPAQQLRSRKSNSSQFNIHNEIERNNRALLKLFYSNCIKYGHIERGKNHFQYYINTQDFFYYAQQDIMEWLKGLENKILSENSKLNIIFVPEHNTNVGFAQFINIYCFNGTAEVISINIDKEYRSNFICEHKAIKTTIKILLDLWNPKNNNDDECPVKFYFIDDSIITGGTFNRANDLLLSLLPGDKIKYFPANLFSKIFVLVDRLSNNSKKAYVLNPEKNFHSFLHIDISSLRTSGDSCICCKLGSEAEKLFTKSSTKKLAEYWNNKIYNRFAVSFDEENKTDPKAALRVLISHIANNYLVNDNLFLAEDELIIKLYNKFLFDENHINDDRLSLFNDGIYDNFYYQLLLNEIKNECENPLERVGLLTKIISRPFLSFDSRLKQATLRYLLLLIDSILRNNQENKIVYFLQKIDDKEKLEFLQNVVLESLSDLKSNYYLRKETIKNIAVYIDKLNVDKDSVQKFYGCFAAFIHSAIDCGNDETKPLWFEYLLLFGNEYNKNSNNNSDFKSLYSSFFSANNGLKNTEYIFKYFCNELFLMNTSVLFKGIETRKNEKDKINIKEQNFDYFMNNWKVFRKIDKTKYDNNILNKEIDLFEAINDLSKPDNNDKLLNDRYKRVFDKLTDTLKEKYEFVVSCISYALLTSYAQQTNEESDKITTISDFDIISMTNDEQVNSEISLKKYFIKEFICKAIEKNNNDLHSWGYIISEDNNMVYGNNIFKIAIFFDSPEKQNNIEYYSKYEIKRITPVYLYIDINFNSDISYDNKEKYSLLVLRDVLMYRYKFMRALDSDFSSDIFGQYAHKRDEANLIAHEKALSHATTSDDAIEYDIIRSKILDKEKLSKNEKELLWIIFKSYVNRQISKLYCRNFNTESRDNRKITPLYIKGGEGYRQDREKAFMYQPINNLKPLVDDPRFILLKEIVEFPDLDENRNNILYMKIFENKERGNYNREYLLCLLFDIIFTGVKYSSEIFYKLQDLVNNYSGNDNKQKKPIIEFKIDKNCLVIKNSVLLGTHTANVMDYEDRNKIIKYRLENPIDFPDGRMSLGVIKKYIEGLYNNKTEHTLCNFEFIKVDEESTTKGRLGVREKLYFETRLPIFDNIGENT